MSCSGVTCITLYILYIASSNTEVRAAYKSNHVVYHNKVTTHKMGANCKRCPVSTQRHTLSSPVGLASLCLTQPRFGFTAKHSAMNALCCHHITLFHGAEICILLTFTPHCGGQRRHCVHSWLQMAEADVIVHNNAKS